MCRKFKVLSLIAASLLIYATNSSAIETISSYDADLISEYLITDSTATVSNFEIIGSNGSVGYFTNSSNLWGLDSGIILSSGSVTDYGDGINSSSSNSTAFGSIGDTQLNSLTGYNTYDAASISFDFRATSNQISFDFVFGSEEYQEFVGSSFNDGFGVWLTDSEGNSTQITYDNNYSPISINSAWMSDTPGTELDGTTGVLTTTASVVEGNKYSLKFSIADASDEVYDSTVYVSNLQGVDSADPTAYGIFVGADLTQDGNNYNPTNLADIFFESGILEEENTVILDSGSTWTEQSIIDAIDSFALSDDDTLYFYGSGHGGTSDSLEGESTETTGDEWLDLNGPDMYDDELTTYLSNLDEVNKWVFLDSCHSGGFWGDGTELGGDLDSLTNIAFFASAAEDGSAWFEDFGSEDTYYWTVLLEQALSKNLIGFLNADYNFDGQISFDELNVYMNLTDWWIPLVHTYAYESGDPANPELQLIEEFTHFSTKSDDFAGSVSGYVYVDPNASTNPQSPVPEPASLLLVGIGLLGFAGVSRKKIS